MDVKETAKQIRKMLKENFSDVKFSVRISRVPGNSQFDDITIRWVDGPTEETIEESIEEFITSNRVYFEREIVHADIEAEEKERERQDWLEFEAEFEAKTATSQEETEAEFDVPTPTPTTPYFVYASPVFNGTIAEYLNQPQQSTRLVKINYHLDVSMSQWDDLIHSVLGSGRHWGNNDAIEGILVRSHGQKLIIGKNRQMLIHPQAI